MEDRYARRWLVVRAVMAAGAVLGVGVAALPRWGFPVCEFKGLYAVDPTGANVFMACHDTARAALWLGAFIAAIAVLGALWDAAAGVRIAAGVTFVAGVLTVALPRFIAPVCVSSTMPCANATAPALTVIGTLIAVLGLIAFAVVPDDEQGEDAEEDGLPDDETDANGPVEGEGGS